MARTPVSAVRTRRSRRLRAVLRGTALAVASLLLVPGPLAGTSSAQIPADLAITKTAQPDPSVIAGNTLTYTITVTNTGPGTAENVVVRDFGPTSTGQPPSQPAVTIDSVSGTGGATCHAGVPGDPARPTRCNFGDMANTDVRTMTFVVTVLPRTTDQLNNDAEVTSDTPDPNDANNLALKVTDVNTEADIQITNVSSPPNTVRAGTPIDYTVKVQNDGPSTGRQVTLTDEIPDQVTFLSVERNGSLGTVAGECSHLDGVPTEPPDSVECQLNDLDPFEFVVVQIHTFVKSATIPQTITNSAEATTSADFDPGAPNTTTDPTDVIDPADLEIVNTSDRDVYKPSSEIKYTLTVTNHGPADAVDVEVTDTLPPADVAPYVYDTAGCAFAPGPNTLTCSLGTIVVGASKSFNVYVRVKGNKSQFDNTGDVDSANVTPDPVLSNNTSIRRVCVRGSSPAVC
jgi:uncharacterized repeat protein (TIGR01451 family)